MVTATGKEASAHYAGGLQQEVHATLCGRVTAGGKKALQHYAGGLQQESRRPLQHIRGGLQQEATLCGRVTNTGVPNRNEFMNISSSFVTNIIILTTSLEVINYSI